LTCTYCYKAAGTASRQRYHWYPDR
jgi:hypothetical protein